MLDKLSLLFVIFSVTVLVPFTRAGLATISLLEGAAALSCIGAGNHKMAVYLH